MQPSEQVRTDQAFFNRMLDTILRIGIVLLLVAWCYDIVRPFINLIVWGAIIAVALYPLFLKLLRRLGNRHGLAATVFTLVVLALLVTPTVMLSASLADGVQELAQGLKDGTLKVPPPPDSVATWPMIGEATHKFWRLASTNLEAAAQQLAPQLKSVGSWLLSAAAGVGVGLLQFIVSIIVAGVFMATADEAVGSLNRLATRLAGERGEDLTSLSGKTVRSVAQGVLGVAFIQALLAGIGLLVMDVPGAGLWALLVLLLAVVQLPPLLVLGPIAVYAFSVADTLPAVLFLIWSLLVSMSDGLLKPLLLGRGLDIPMLVILLGAIGGMISSGILGLFIGSVILAVGYKLFKAWLDGGAGPAKEAGSAAGGAAG